MVVELLADLIGERAGAYFALSTYTCCYLRLVEWLNYTFGHAINATFGQYTG